MTSGLTDQLGQVLSIAADISDQQLLRRAWVRGEGNRVPFEGPGNLYRAVFEELEAPTVAADVRAGLIGDTLLADALDDFSNRLQHACFWAEAALGAGELPLHEYAADLLSSDAWKKLTTAAAQHTYLAAQLPPYGDTSR